MLQETKLHQPDTPTLKSYSLSSHDRWSVLNSIGASGGQIISWDSSKFTLIAENSSHFTLSVTLHHLPSNKQFTFSSVYGPCGNVDRSGFWNEIRQARRFAADTWVLGGDFNITRIHGERLGHDLYLEDMLAFNDVVRDLELQDPPISGRTYTWSNDRVTPSAAKLDRFLISPACGDLFPLITVKALPRPISDHSPIMLNTNDCIPYMRPFRFEKMWLLHENFDSMIVSHWAALKPRHHDAGARLAMKLKSLRYFLKRWNFSSFGNIKTSKLQILDMIQHLDTIADSRPLHQDEILSKSSLLAQLESIQLKEETMWAQRARTTWLKEGDANTSFFHRVASGRRQTNHISQLQHGDVTHTTQQDISTALNHFFRSIFGSPVDTATDLNWQLLYPDNIAIPPQLV